MLLNKTFYQGQSLTIGVLIADTYDTANLQSSAIIIGEKKIASAVINQMLRFELSSEDTRNFITSKAVNLVIDDAYFGRREYPLGSLSFEKTKGQTFDTSIDEGYTVVFNATINEVTIAIDSIMYDYVKGDKGGMADLPAGTVIDPNYVHTDNNYTTADKAKVSNLSGTNTGDQDLSGFSPVGHTHPYEPANHTTLLDKNAELTNQHLDTTSEKATPIDTDSFGLWDSVTSTFKRLSVANMLAWFRSVLISSSRSQSTSTIPSSKLLDDELNKNIGIYSNSYPIDFNILNTADGNGGGIIWINDIPVTQRGILQSLRVKSGIGITVTAYVYAIAGSEGSYTFTKLHTFAPFVTTAEIHTQEFNDSYVIEAGQFIGYLSKPIKFGSVGHSYYVGNSGKQNLTLAYDFVINTNLVGGFKNRIENLETEVAPLPPRILELESQVSVFEKDYIINFGLANSGVSGSGFTFFNKIEITKPGLLKSLRIKAQAGTVITPKLYSIVDNNGVLTMTLLHTYSQFTTTSTDIHTQQIDDSHYINAGEYIGVQLQNGNIYYGFTGSEYKTTYIGSSSWVGGQVLTYDFIISEQKKDNIITAIENINKYIGTIEGKRLTVCGDSIMQMGRVTSVIESETKCILTNLAIGGTYWGLYGENVDAQLETRITNIINSNPEMILISWGTNDFGFNRELGSLETVTNGNNTQTYTSIYNHLRRIKEELPLVPVLLLTPIQRCLHSANEYRGFVNAYGKQLVDYANAVKHVSKIFSCEVLDLYSISGITFENIDIVTDEGLHVNLVGGKMMAAKIIPALKNLYK